MALGTQIAAASDALFGLLFRFRFRYDLFLSYARSDGKQYALKLRDQLQALDFSCFLDQDELPPGNSLRSSLSRALRRSATLVVVGTERALQSRYVAQEIAEFAATGRAILPVDFQGTLADPPWSVLRERDLVWIDETREALAHGVPSPAVADGIDKLFKYTRRNVRVRGQILTTALLFLIGAAISGWIINDKVRDLDRATVTANVAKREAGKAAQEAQKQTRLANENKIRAAAEARRAQEQERIALANAGRAQREQQRAEEKTREAEARLLATEAERSRDGSTDGLVRSVLLATQSLQKTPLLEGRIALAQGLRLLPRRLEAGIPGSCGIVYAAAFSPDGRRLAIGGQEGLAVLDPAESWRPRVEALRGRQVRALAFSRDGSRLAAGVEGGVHVLDPTTGQTVAAIPPGEHLRENVHSLAFSPDGRYLAAVTMDFTATLLERSPEDGAWRVVLPSPNLGEYRRVLSVAFSSDSRWLALGGVGEIAIWDVAQRTKIARAEARETFGVAFVAESRNLITAGLSEIRFWQVDPSTGLLSESREDRISTGSGIRALALSADERFFATWNDGDRTVSLWKISDRQERSRMILPPDAAARVVAFTPDGGRLVTAIGDALDVWPASGTHELALLAGSKAVAFSPSGHWLAMGGARSVRLLQVPETVSPSAVADPASWPDLARWDLADEISFVSFSPDGRWLAAATASSIQVIDTRTRRRVLQKPVEGELSAVVFSPGGQWLVATAEASVHRIATGSWRESPPIEPQEGLSRLAFSPDETWMGTQTEPDCTRYGLVRPALTRIYEAKTGRQIAWWSHEEDDLKKCNDKKSESFEGLQVKEGGRIDLLRQAASWRELEHRKPRSATSPDGRWEASIESWEVTLADKASGRVIDHLDHDDLSDVSFSPDSRWLVTAGTGGAVKVWSLTREDLIGQACARLSDAQRSAETACGF